MVRAWARKVATGPSRPSPLFSMLKPRFVHEQKSSSPCCSTAWRDSSCSCSSSAFFSRGGSLVSTPGIPPDLVSFLASASCSMASLDSLHSLCCLRQPSCSLANATLSPKLDRNPGIELTSAFGLICSDVKSPSEVHCSPQ